MSDKLNKEHSWNRLYSEHNGETFEILVVSEIAKVKT